MRQKLGVVQRCILYVLAEQDRLIDTIELTALAFDVHSNDAGQYLVNDAQVVSVRRALRKLSRAGKVVDLGREWRDGRRRWATPAAAERYYQVRAARY
jgi:hypothetical protein